MQKIFLKKQTTSFQRKVYEAVKKIPKGKVLTYKEVAEKIGLSKSYRAVGNALNKNRNPEVPCHRVIRANGTIGGFCGGTKKKIALLKKEGVIIEKVLSFVNKTSIERLGGARWRGCLQ